MGCGCKGGSGAAATGSKPRPALLKKPGFTWNGPEVEEEQDTEAEAEEDEALVASP